MKNGSENNKKRCPGTGDTRKNFLLPAASILLASWLFLVSGAGCACAETAALKTAPAETAAAGTVPLGKSAALADSANLAGDANLDGNSVLGEDTETPSMAKTDGLADAANADSEGTDGSPSAAERNASKKNSAEGKTDAEKEAVENATGFPVFGEEDLSWDMTEDELTAVLGEPESIYFSIYGGDALTYPAEYLGREGTLKLMFSEDGALASVAWAYITPNADDLISVYEEIDGYEIERNGESGFSSQHSTSFGDVWYLEDRDVLISTIFGSDSCGLQYAYIARSFSRH